MRLRFRKRIKILPGLWMNLSKSMPSLSVRGHGATINVSKRGLKGTLGLPGSGLSVSETMPWKKDIRDELAAKKAAIADKLKTDLAAINAKYGKQTEIKTDSQPAELQREPDYSIFHQFDHFALIAGLDAQIETAMKEGNFEQAANIRQEREKLYTRFPETSPAKDPDFLRLLGKGE